MDLSGIIKAGLAREEFFLVAENHSAAEVGSGPAFSLDGTLEVLSSPSLAAFMECVAFRLLQEQLPEDLTSLGTSVQINHKAPTLVGRRVRVRAEVSAMEGRRVTLILQGWEGPELVAEGTHQRVVVERQDFRERLLRRRDNQG